MVGSVPCMCSLYAVLCTVHGDTLGREGGKGGVWKVEGMIRRWGGGGGEMAACMLTLQSCSRLHTHPHSLCTPLKQGWGGCSEEECSSKRRRSTLGSSCHCHSC